MNKNLFHRRLYNLFTKDIQNLSFSVSWTIMPPCRIWESFSCWSRFWLLYVAMAAVRKLLGWGVSACLWTASGIPAPWCTEGSVKIQFVSTSAQSCCCCSITTRFKNLQLMLKQLRMLCLNWLLIVHNPLPQPFDVSYGIHAHHTSRATILADHIWGLKWPWLNNPGFPFLKCIWTPVVFCVLCVSVFPVFTGSLGND